MTHGICKTALVAALALGPAIAMADGWYIGAKAGLMATDANGFDDATNAGVVVGYDVLDVIAGDISLEGEYTTTIDDGEAPGLAEWEVDTLGGYAVFRTAGPAYLKMRGGVVRSDITYNGVSDATTDSAAGLGIGFSLGLVQLELDYTKINTDDDDIDFVSLTANFF